MHPQRQAANLRASNVAHIVHELELSADCIVTVQSYGDDYDGEWKQRGFRAWANRDDEFRPGCSRTVATSSGDTAIEALDRLARELGCDPDAEAINERNAA